MDKISDMMNAEENALNEGVGNNPSVSQQEEGSVAEEEAVATVKKMTKQPNGIAVKKKLIDSIVNVLMGLKYLDKSYRALQLYILDEANVLAYSSILEEEGFEEDLRLQLSNGRIHLGNNWQWQCFFKTDPPAIASKLGEGLWLALDGSSTPVKSYKAKVKAVAGKLTQEEFVLEETGRVYNIGRGADPRLDSGSPHHNHIAIASDEFDGITPEELTINRYVSRAHASIICEPGKGYALQVLPGGTPFKNNRTRILRTGGDTVDLNNTAVAYPLQNGDKIELGKNVILQFDIAE